MAFRVKASVTRMAVDGNLSVVFCPLLPIVRRSVFVTKEVQLVGEIGQAALWVSDVSDQCLL